MSDHRCAFTASALFEKIRTLPDREIEKLGKRKRLLRNALTALNTRLASFPERERNAALSLLYEEIIDSIFDFHRCLENAAARKKVAASATMEQKLEVARAYRTTIGDLATLYESADQ